MYKYIPINKICSHQDFTEITHRWIGFTGSFIPIPYGHFTCPRNGAYGTLLIDTYWHPVGINIV